MIIVQDGWFTEEPKPVVDNMVPMLRHAWHVEPGTFKIFESREEEEKFQEFMRELFAEPLTFPITDAIRNLR